MQLASSPSALFAADRCGDLSEQERRVRESHGNTRCLDLSPLRCKTAFKRPEPWLFSTDRSGREIDLVAGVLLTRAHGRSLALFPPIRLSAPDVFWQGIEAFVREHDVRRFSVEAAGFEPPEIAELPGEIRRGVHTGLWVDLHAEPAPLPKNHRRNVQRALKQGAEHRLTTDVADASSHFELCVASIERIERRGEYSQGIAPRETAEDVLRSGLGCLHQAWVGEQLLSSDLVIHLGQAAYYASGGTAPEGRKAGTAHFLMAEIVRSLREQGFRSLNMGYPNGPGLTRFKQGFGATPYSAQRVDVERGPWIERLLRRLVRASRR